MFYPESWGKNAEAPVPQLIKRDEKGTKQSKKGTNPVPRSKTDETVLPPAYPAPRFDVSVPSQGYRWWYVDAVSDDHAHALTLIVFIGSVFSPYYAWAGHKHPDRHCAVNLALYGNKPRAWCMTERGRAQLEQSEETIAIGPSSLSWTGEGLHAHINEITVPIPGRVKGHIRLFPEARPAFHTALDTSRRHHWWPIAPHARVEAHFEEPALSWSGTGYFDTNWGNQPLEEGFRGWSWSRAPLEQGAAIAYDVTERTGTKRSLAVHIDRRGRVEDFTPPPFHPLPGTLWRVPRAIRSELQAPPDLRMTCEDTPFYTRSVAETTLFGERAVAFHESLDLDRFDSLWVQMLLPFRMPRRPF